MASNHVSRLVFLFSCPKNPSINHLNLYCIVLYCIVLYCIVLYCIVLYCIVLYCIVLYCIVCIVLYCIVLYRVVSYCIKQIDNIFPCVCVYCNRSQKTSQRLKNNSHATRFRLVSYVFVLYAVTSSVIYYSAHTRKNVIYLLNSDLDRMSKSD